MTGGGAPSTGGGDAATGGGAPAGGGAAPDAGPTPITAPPDTWTWVDFPESRCASGTPTGLGINPHAGATQLLIFMQGGGSCASGESCWGSDPGAANLDGYDAAKFGVNPQLGYPIFSRTGNTNPFTDWGYVFIPYCTGDLHGGTLERDLVYDGGTVPTYFWGGTDLALFLPRLTATFPDVTRVVITGGSAGGFGTMLSFDRVADAFGTRVDLLDDSGPPIVAKNGTQNGLLAYWGYQTPGNCAAPCNSFEKVLDAARQRQPGSRYGFMSFQSDPTISTDYGYSLAEYATLLDDTVNAWPADGGMRAFIVTNEERHVVMSELLLAPQYLPWITQMVNDDPAWENITYQHP